MKILIVEDEPALNKSMVEYLTAQKYVCESVANYSDAMYRIETFHYDCIVLDIMLPGGSGLDLLKSLREVQKTEGVIIISARNELDDKIEGLRLGADDYQVKPFHLAELSSRIAAIIRRKKLSASDLLRFHEITIDINSIQVTVGNKEVSLTRKEYDLLLYFVINKNRVLSKSAIAEHLWGDNMYMVDNYDFIYAHIKNLRRKLLQAGAEDYIQSVYGLGYKISAR